MKKSIGNIFIVPNMLRVRNEFDEHHYTGNKMTNLLKDDELFVEVWISSHECKNWQNHKHPDFTFFPAYFPVSLFDGKQEGDTITIYTDDKEKEIILTLNQLGYQYRNVGRFEEALSNLKKHYEEFYQKTLSIDSIVDK